MVRAEGPPASDDDGCDGPGVPTKLRFQARHYRILETLALPGAEDAPVRASALSRKCSVRGGAVKTQPDIFESVVEDLASHSSYGSRPWIDSIAPD